MPAPAADAEGAVLTGTVLSARGATLAEFEDYLRTVNSRDGRPYEEKTIVNYVGPGKNVDAWMTGNGIVGDFSTRGADAAVRVAWSLADLSGADRPGPDEVNQAIAMRTGAVR